MAMELMHTFVHSTEEVRSYWEVRASAWTDLEKHFLLEYPDELGAIYQALRKTRRNIARVKGRILDIGSGGLPVLYLPEQALSRTTAIDVSRPALVVNDSANRVLADVRFGLPFRDQSFRYTTSFFLMRYIEDQKMLVEEIVRITKPRGRIVIVDFDTTVKNNEMEISEFDPYQLVTNSALACCSNVTVEKIHEGERLVDSDRLSFNLFLISALK